MMARMLGRAWMLAARVRRRVGAGRPGAAMREELVLRHARGRSFADVGCMWGVHGAIAFLAEAAGASRVTGVDVMRPTPEFEAEHARRRSSVRFVQGDLHDSQVVGRVGIHDVVWCSGVLYHSPHPLLVLERLREITGELLLLASETVPEVPGVAQACVFLPGLERRDRHLHAAARPGAHSGLTTEFSPERGYANWYWGISRSALVSMVATSGFEVLEVGGNPFHATVVASRR